MLVLSSLDIDGQLLNNKLFQKLPAKKLTFMLYLAISKTAVLMLMFKLAQAAAELILLALYIMERLATNLFK